MAKPDSKSKKIIIPRIVTRPSQKFVTKRKPKVIKTEKLIYLCKWKTCKDKFETALDLDTHLQTHVEKDKFKGIFKCQWDSCTFSTCDKIEFLRHVCYHGYHSSLLKIGQQECKKNKIPPCLITDEKRNSIPELKQNFQCFWIGCKRSFESIVEFQDHIERHASFDYDLSKTPEDLMPRGHCNWQHCHKTFPNRYRLLEHTRAHSDQKFLGCYQCGELFRTKTTLFDHCKRQEANNPHKYQCGQCFKFYATEKLLRKHVVVHVNCFKCSMCDMTCNSTNALATHIRYRHLKDKPITCPECDHTCVTKGDMDKHRRHVHSKLMYRCKEAGCSYSVKAYDSFRRHYLEVHANSPFIYLCHYCDKLFKHGKLLSRHLIAKHKFQLPSGHKRFTYRLDENGFYSLETTRIESLEVTRQILSPVLFEMSELTEDSSNYEIVSLTNANQNEYEEAEPVQQVVITINNEE